MEGGLGVGKRRHRPELAQALPLRPFLPAGACKGGVQVRAVREDYTHRRVQRGGCLFQGCHPLQGSVPQGKEKAQSGLPAGLHSTHKSDFHSRRERPAGSSCTVTGSASLELWF